MNLWSGADDGATADLRRMLDVALDGDTDRLGRLLAPMGVRYVVVPSQLAPDPDGGAEAPPPPQLTRTLAGQLDLEEVPLVGGTDRLPQRRLGLGPRRPARDRRRP